MMYEVNLTVQIVDIIQQAWSLQADGTSSDATLSSAATFGLL